MRLFSQQFGATLLVSGSTKWTDNGVPSLKQRRANTNELETHAIRTHNKPMSHATAPRSYGPILDLECARCSQPFRATLWAIVDACARPDLVDKLCTDRLHILACPGCGEEIRHRTTVLVFQPQLRPVIVVVPLSHPPTSNDQYNASQHLRRLRAQLGFEWDERWVRPGIPTAAPGRLRDALAGDPAAISCNLPTYLETPQDAGTTVAESLTVPLRELDVARVRCQESNSPERSRAYVGAIEALLQHPHVAHGTDFHGQLHGELVRALAQQSMAFGDVDAADRAVREGLVAASHRVPSAEQVQVNQVSLACAYVARFEVRHDMQDLDLAISTFEESLQSAATSHLSVSIEASIGDYRMRRYKLGGGLADLHDAIRRISSAVSKAHPETPPPAGWLNNLGGAHLQRFYALERTADSDDAIRYLTAALSKASTREAAEWTSNLGAAYLARYGNTDAEADLDAAVTTLELGRDLLGVSGPASRAMATAVGNTASGYLCRYRRSSSEQDWVAALAALHAAIDMDTRAGKDASFWRTKLARAFGIRFQQAGGYENLEKAITFGRSAVAAAPHRSLVAADALAHFAAAAAISLRIAPNPDLFKEALAACKAALDTYKPLAFPSAALAVSKTLAELLFGCADFRRLGEITRVLEDAMTSSDHLYFEALHQSRRQRWHDETRGLYALLARTRASMGELEKAAEAIEAGRARGVLETIRGAHALIHMKPESRTVLEAAWVAMKGDEDRVRRSGQSGAGGRDRAAQALTVSRATYYRLLREEFPGYFRSPTYSAIQQEVIRSGDTLVYLACTPLGGLALVLHEGRIEEVACERLDARSVHRLLVQYAQGRPVAGYSVGQLLSTKELRRCLPHVLGTLSADVVRPLADRLRSLYARRVVLIPTGQLGLLPFHAAGTGDGTQTLLDEFDVVYALSAASWISARAQSVARQSSRRALVAVSASSGDDATPLPFSVAEVHQTARLVDPAATILRADGVSKNALLQQVTTATHVHLACHGTFYGTEPSRSTLSVGLDSPLSLADVWESREYFAQARLVVLSACQSGLFDIRDAPDEVVGFPAAFCEAGVPAVVGTLWRVADRSTALLMQRFYECLVDDAMQDVAEGQRAARALRRAATWLRDASAAELVTRLHGLVSVQGSEAPLPAAELGWADLDARPYADPYYWAPFVVVGG